MTRTTAAFLTTQVLHQLAINAGLNIGNAEFHSTPTTLTLFVPTHLFGPFATRGCGLRFDRVNGLTRTGTATWQWEHAETRGEEPLTWVSPGLLTRHCPRTFNLAVVPETMRQLTQLEHEIRAFIDATANYLASRRKEYLTK